jgi:predicted RNase H-like HicB family nuclease
MKTYHIDIIEEKKGGYFIKVREFKGCMTQGETIGEALVNIADALNGWIKSCIKHNNKIPEGK